MIPKITDLLVSGLLKKGILYEARGVDTDVQVPIIVNGTEQNVKINIKCEHMTLRIEKD